MLLTLSLSLNALALLGLFLLALTHADDLPRLISVPVRLLANVVWYPPIRYIAGLTGWYSMGKVRGWLPAEGLAGARASVLGSLPYLLAGRLLVACDVSVRCEPVETRQLLVTRAQLAKLVAGAKFTALDLGDGRFRVVSVG